MLYGLVQLVDNGSVTEGKPLDAARVALIRDRLGELLLEQTGAFETYDTGVQRVTPAMWWDEAEKKIGNPIQLAWVARCWPNQPLSGTIATFYEISLAAWGIAQRPSELPKWLGKSPKSKAFLRKLALQTGRTEERARVLSANFDDRRKREAEELVQIAAAKFRRAVSLLISHADDELAAAREVVNEPFIDVDAIWRHSRNGSALLEKVETFVASLAETSLAGLAVPRSAGHWKVWETTMGNELISLGVPKSRVLGVFRLVAADPEDERTRISKNLRRSKKNAKVTLKPAAPKKRVSAVRSTRR